MDSAPHEVTRKSPYSNIDIVIMANRTQFPMSAFDNAPVFGLMNIANKPILSHLLKRLQEFGFKNLYLVCNQENETAYSNFLDEAFPKVVTVIKDDGTTTTGDIIRNMKSTNHILLMPIDLITSVDLTKFIDFHIASFSKLTAFVTSYEISSKERSMAPGVAAANTAESSKYYFVLDDKRPDQLLYLLSDEEAIKDDMDITVAQANRDENLQVFENMEIPAHVLQNSRSMSIDCSRRFTRSYLLSPECVEFIRKNTNIYSIQSQLIPELSSNNMKITIFNDDPKDTTVTISDFAALYYTNLKCASKSLGCFDPAYPFTPQQSESVGYYAGTQLTVAPNFRFDAFCVYGSGLVAEQQPLTITRSVIGKNCKIGKNVKIIRSVIYDNVTIEDNVSITSSIVGSDATIRSGSDVKRTVVCPKYACEEPLTSDQNIVKRREN